MLKRLFPYMKTYQRYLVLACFCVIAETIFELIIPILMADIIDVGVANADKEYIIMKGAQMIVCALLALVLGVFICQICRNSRTGFWC